MWPAHVHVQVYMYIVYTCIYMYMYMYNNIVYTCMYMESHVHNTLAINKESRHGEQTLTHDGKYMYLAVMYIVYTCMYNMYINHHVHRALQNIERRKMQNTHKQTHPTPPQPYTYTSLNGLEMLKCPNNHNG